MTDGDRQHILDALFELIESRKGGDPETSYTAKLLARGHAQAAKKMGEEAFETALAAVDESPERLAEESADLLYHLMVLWAAAGITADDVWTALEARRGTSGIEEKRARASKG